MEQIDLDKIDIYEVDKKDYEAYFYRLPKNEIPSVYLFVDKMPALSGTGKPDRNRIIKTAPREKLTIWKDLITGFEICGYETTQIMGTDCNRFFIFNFMEEKRLGNYKTTKYVYLSEKEYEKFLNLLPLSKKENG